MTATEMAKKIGTRGIYKVGKFEIGITIMDLQDIVGKGTMCLIVARGVKGEDWVPLNKIYYKDEEKEDESRTIRIY